MNICLFSSFFYPSVGGVETASRTLAEGWTALGHRVIVVTATPGNEQDDHQFPFAVIRSPDNRRWRELLANCDVIVSNGLSLRHFRVWRQSGVPFGWISPMVLGDYSSVRSAVRLHLRRFATHLGHFNICVSAAMKRHIRNRKAVVIHNAVSPLFRPLPDVEPSGRFLFYGRMWRPKGMHVLLEALAEGRRRGVELPTDFVGDGVDLAATQQLARDLQLGDLARFIPPQTGDQLVHTINAALAVVVPSTWEEPFGLTAAEAMACGKCVVSSRAGGLTEVVEGAGITFRNGDVHELAARLVEIQRDAALRRQYEDLGLRRAGDFAPDVVCTKYLQVFEAAIARSGKFGKKR